MPTWCSSSVYIILYLHIHSHLRILIAGLTIFRKACHFYVLSKAIVNKYGKEHKAFFAVLLNELICAVVKAFFYYNT